MNKYLTELEIDAIIGEVNLSPGYSTMSQDSYNETLIAEAILKTEKVNELLECTINLAVVGFGNKKYGNYRINDQIIDIATVLRNNGVKLNNASGAQLKEDDLTPNRLCRFFRHKIRKYLTNTKVSSYIFRKYTTRDVQYANICFRGAEYLEDLSIDQFNYLLSATGRLDAKLGTNVSERIRRVHEAKTGYLVI